MVSQKRQERRDKLKAQLKQLSSKELKAEVPLEEEPDHGTKDVGSFTYGYCKSCDWHGHGRRARDKARRDALLHAAECPKKGKIRVGTTDHK